MPTKDKQKDIGKRPTSKQRKLARLVSENVRDPKPMGQLMKQAGYSEQTSKRPHSITETRTFQQALIEAGGTDEAVASVFIDAMKANRVDTVRGASTVTDIPDHSIRLKAGEAVAKLKGYKLTDNSGGNTYNTFVQNNQLNPNEDIGKSIVDNTLDMLMQQTAWDNTTEGIIDQPSE